MNEHTCSLQRNPHFLSLITLASRDSTFNEPLGLLPTPLWLSQPLTTHFMFSMLTPKRYRIFLKEESLQHVFIIEISFGEIVGYRCKSIRIKGGCSRTQIISIILNHPLSCSVYCFASKAHVGTEQLVWFLGVCLASFLGTTNNTPYFTVISTKKIELHIVAPLST